MKSNNNNNNGNGNTKLILLHPYIQKQGTSNRVWLLAVLTFFTVAFLLTLIYTRDALVRSEGTVAAGGGAAAAASAGAAVPPPLPTSVISTLVHYASRSNESFHMTHPELKSISDVLRKCSHPCNFLVFGLTHETLLWKALNYHGRTVVVEENRYYAAYFEELHPDIDVFDVQYTTRAGEMDELLASARELARQECRPVQNLLFSECRLAINDLPNHMYDVDWDVILVDGPRGEGTEAPGRMMSIFTAGVLARSKKVGGKTHVFVHDYYRDVEQICGDEFLCGENLVEAINGMLAHFVVERMEKDSFQFCREQNGTAAAAAAAARSGL
ncbi:unnamed protein product [Linum tenue]|uniref:Polysaccharide biosynthesis domain-containing protein n=1 Tax=Linum tenue TaxID=586396 RepID=A0AAV0J803_9ROSI|nr:unnamed protein product [Linum tenue]